MEHYNMVKGKKGFTVIELMVVVSIIGLLATIALPQFRKYQRQALQASAKAELSAVYMAQKVFKSEKGTFYGNLWATGYKPEGTITYRVFRQGSTVTSSLPGMNVYPLRYNDSYDTYNTGSTTATICGISFSAGVTGNKCQQDTSSWASYGDILNESTFDVTKTSFVIGAAAVLGGSETDVWTINQNQDLVNTHNGAL